MYRHYFSNFGRPPVPDDICTDSAVRRRRFWRRFLKVFSFTNAKGSKLDLAVKKVKCQCTTIILAILVDLYKCKGKQTWPCCKKVKCDCTTIILAILVDPRPRWFMQRFSPKTSSVLEKKIFKGFYHIWAWLPSWSMNGNHFSNLSFPCPREAPNAIWTILTRGSRGEVVWNSEHFSHTNA